MKMRATQDEGDGRDWLWRAVNRNIIMSSCLRAQLYPLTMSSIASLMADIESTRNRGKMVVTGSNELIGGISYNQHSRKTIIKMQCIHQHEIYMACTFNTFIFKQNECDQAKCKNGSLHEQNSHQKLFEKTFDDINLIGALHCSEQCINYTRWRDHVRRKLSINSQTNGNFSKSISS